MYLIGFFLWRVWSWYTGLYALVPVGKIYMDFCSFFGVVFVYTFFLFYSLYLSVVIIAKFTHPKKKVLVTCMCHGDCLFPLNLKHHLWGPLQKIVGWITAHRISTTIMGTKDNPGGTSLSLDLELMGSPSVILSMQLIQKTQCTPWNSPQTKSGGLLS